jgi:hypothetical protein
MTVAEDRFRDFVAVQTIVEGRTVFKRRDLSQL